MERTTVPATPRAAVAPPRSRISRSVRRSWSASRERSSSQTPNASTATFAPKRTLSDREEIRSAVGGCLRTRARRCALDAQCLFELEGDEGEQSVTFDLEHDRTVGLQRIQRRSQLLE